MKTLITYCTTHGCTEKAALELKNALEENVDLINLKKNSSPDLSIYDRVIIGGSIHAGQIQKKVKDFCSKNLNDLKSKELGLFICCMEEGEKAEAQFAEAFPKALRQNAKATACFGGEFDFEKMNYFQKLIVKKVAKISASTSKVDHDAIKKFSVKMDKVFNLFLFLA